MRTALLPAVLPALWSGVAVAGLVACADPSPFPGRSCPQPGSSFRYEPPTSCGSDRRWDLPRWLSSHGRPVTRTSQVGQREPAPFPAQDLAGAVAAYRAAWSEVIGPIPRLGPEGEEMPLEVCRETPVLSPAQAAEVDDAAYHMARVTYRGAHGAFIPAYLLLPRGVTGSGNRVPAVVVAHQALEACGKDEAVGICARGQSTLAFARALARRGLVTLAPDTVGYGERSRCSVRAGYDYVDAQPLLARYPDATLIGLRLSDLGRAVDFLTSLPEVDPRRIGVIGHSSGAIDALFAAAFEPRVRCAVSNAGPNLVRREIQRQSGVDLVPGIARWAGFGYLPALGFYNDDVAALPVEFHQLYALAADRTRGGLFVSLMEDDSVAPRYDRIEFSLAQARLAHDALGGRFASHTIASGRTPECRAQYGIPQCLALGYDACAAAQDAACLTRYATVGVTAACAGAAGSSTACAMGLYWDACRQAEGRTEEECLRRFGGTDPGHPLLDPSCIERGTVYACSKDHGWYPQTEALAFPWLETCLRELPGP